MEICHVLPCEMPMLVSNELDVNYFRLALEMTYHWHEFHSKPPTHYLVPHQDNSVHRNAYEQGTFGTTRTRSFYKFGARTIDQPCCQPHALFANLNIGRDLRPTSDFFCKLMEHLDVKQEKSATYHPQTDRQTQVINRTLKDCIRAVSWENKTNGMNNWLYQSSRWTMFQTCYR